MEWEGKLLKDPMLIYLKVCVEIVKSKKNKR